MTSTPVFDDGTVRPFRQNQQQFNLTNIRSTSQNLQDVRLRYSDITARVIGFETKVLPVNHYGRSSSTPIQSPTQGKPTPPPTATFYKILVSGHYIKEFDGVCKGNGVRTDRVSYTEKIDINYIIYRRFKEFNNLNDSLDMYYNIIPPFPPKESFSSLAGVLPTSSSDSSLPTPPPETENTPVTTVGVNNPSGAQKSAVFKKKRQLQLSTWLQTTLLQVPAILQCEDIDNFLCISENFVVDHQDFPRRVFKSNPTPYGTTDFFWCPQYSTVPPKNGENGGMLCHNTNCIYLTTEDSHITSKIDIKTNNLLSQNSSIYGSLVPLIYTSQHNPGKIDIYDPFEHKAQLSDLLDAQDNEPFSNAFTHALKFLPSANSKNFSSRASCVEVLNNVGFHFNENHHNFTITPSTNTSGITYLTNTIFVGLDNGDIMIFQHDFEVKTADYLDPTGGRSLLKENSLGLKLITTLHYHSKRVEKLTLISVPLTQHAADAQKRRSVSDCNQNYHHIDNDNYSLMLLSSSRDGKVSVYDLFNNKVINIFDALVTSSDISAPYGEIANHYYHQPTCSLFLSTFKGVILHYKLFYSAKDDSIKATVLHGIHCYSDSVRKIDFFDNFHGLCNTSIHGLIAATNYENNFIDIWDFSHTTNSSVTIPLNTQQSFPKLLFSLKLLKIQCKCVCVIPLYLSHVLFGAPEHIEENKHTQTTTHTTSFYYIITGYDRGLMAITLVNVYNAKYSLLYVISAHDSRITQIKFNQERDIIVTASEDKTIAGWSLPQPLSFIERVL